MRWLSKIIGWLFLLIAIAIGILDVYSWVISDNFILTDIGSMWYLIHPISLQVIEPIVSRYIHPALWYPFITNVLLWPATPAFGLLGLTLVLFFRNKTRTAKKDLFNC
jgi:hypothetical protein